MKVRLLSLNLDKAMPFVRFQARITSSLKNYLDEDAGFKNCSNMRTVFEELQDAINEDELILIAVDNKHYLKLKTAIGQAFETEMTYSSSVLNMLESNESITEEERKEFSLFPEPASVFLSNDGLYSAFALGNGEQAIVVLPIDDNRINIILRNGLIPYLQREFEDVQSDSVSSYQLFENEKVQIAVDRLLENNSIVAVDSNKSAEVVRSCGDSTKRFDEVFVFTTSVEDQGDVNPTEYAANKAKVSLNLSAANLGASISDIYSNEDSKYICIAVADEDSAIVRKIFIEEGESDSKFIENCAYELIELIGKKAAGIESVGIEITENTAIIPEDEKKLPTKKSLSLIILLGVIIIGTAVFTVIFNLHHGNGASAKWLRNLFGYTTTETTTDDTTVPVETTDEATTKGYTEKVKLSDMIFADLIAIEKENAEKTTESTDVTSNSQESTSASNEENSEESSEEENSLTELTTEELVEDKGAPEYITVNGERLDAKKAIARFVTSEMDQGYDTEAIKAQAVVIYTYLKYRNTDFVIDDVEISDNYTEEIMECVEDVYGEYISYNGVVALTPYFEVAANKTADADTVFSKSYPYLKSVSIDGNPDTASDDYKNEYKFSLGEVKGMILDYDSSIRLSETPINWILVVKRDNSVSSSIGYVTQVSLGDASVSGYTFVNEVLKSQIASNCFTVNYDDTDSAFTFTTYGVGYGVGMSKTGADYLAKNGRTYKRILSTYFNGTSIEREDNV